MTDMRLVVAGAGGRMGRALVRAIAAESGVILEAAIERSGSPLIGEDSGEIAGLPSNATKISSDAKDALSNADGIIDFTSPSATLSIASFSDGVVHVIGTTGLSDADQAMRPVEFRDLCEDLRLLASVRGNAHTGM